MASALYASQNESSWVHMGKKIPNSNSRLNSNPNPNSNPKKKQKKFHHVATSGGAAGRYNDDSPVVTQTASDDAYSFNQTSTSRSAFNPGEYMTYNISSYTKSELLELQRRLAAELEQIREFESRIDSGQFNINNQPRSRGKSKKLAGNKWPGASLASDKDTKRFSRGYDKVNFGLEPVINYQDMWKECKQILTKLMKHKMGWIFNTPVDAVALGLHDYHQIVKQPMDLGTVKSILSKNLYPSPLQFAADVRLTFNNALLYNPKTDQVHVLAEQLLARFEELFRPIQEKIDFHNMQTRERELQTFQADDDEQYPVHEELNGSSWDVHNQVIASPGMGKKRKPRESPVPVPQMSKKPEKATMPTHSSSSTPSYHPPPPPMEEPLLMREETPSPVKDQKAGRGSTVKLPKPRAKDPNKRDMSMEEKQKLGIGLQSLPQEKMPQLVQIIRKRNEHLAQDGDEIELDIEALDTETLWELDRFVTNWKKMVSKTKRQALMMNNNLPAAPTTPTAEDDMGAMDDGNDMDKRPKKNEDEDVDIDDDMPATNFPPVEIEKDEGGGRGGGHDQDQDRGNNSSSSSSSSSGSSSSSDSDSGSSSGSDSDADDAQS